MKKFCTFVTTLLVALSVFNKKEKPVDVPTSKDIVSNIPALRLDNVPDLTEVEQEIDAEPEFSAVNLNQLK